MHKNERILNSLHLQLILAEKLLSAAARSEALDWPQLTPLWLKLVKVVDKERECLGILQSKLTECYAHEGIPDPAYEDLLREFAARILRDIDDERLELHHDPA